MLMVTNDVNEKFIFDFNQDILILVSKGKLNEYFENRNDNENLNSKKKKSHYLVFFLIFMWCRLFLL